MKRASFGTYNRAVPILEGMMADSAHDRLGDEPADIWIRDEPESSAGGTGTAVRERAAPGAPPIHVPAPRAAMPTPDGPPVRWREVVSVVLLVAVADVAIYRGHGYAGWAALLVAALVLLRLAIAFRPARAAAAITGLMLLVLAGRMLWLGSPWLAATGVLLLVAYTVALGGRRPYVIDVLVHGVQTAAAGAVGLVGYARTLRQPSPRMPRGLFIAIALPLLAVLAFGTLFVLANPDLAESIGRRLDRAFRLAWEWMADVLPDGAEVLFWVAAAWFAAGLLRPLVRHSVSATIAAQLETAEDGVRTEARLYAALRNTLVAVIALFAVYLVFEYKTLWFRDFPKGFYYAGYAHEGAAWLTVALGLTTLVLSAIFRGAVLRDPRRGRLQRLAWVWSAENMLLALAVYNRLFIYIDFNGMTRMRTVGLFGISAVVVGFLLVIWKIARDRDFVWLVQRQLWTLAIALYLLAITPVDPLVHRYNVRRILAGDPAPSVQISVHPIDSGGVYVLHPLTNARDPIIREGIRAMLAERAEQAEALARPRDRQGWTSFQFADRLLLQRLRRLKANWSDYAADTAARDAALQRFHDYAYQWY